MEILNLNTNTLNQNGYHKTILTPGKVGALYMFPQKYTPEDCLACDGYILKIDDYLKLFSVIGTDYNSGTEAEDEFKIPDYNISGRFLQPGTLIGSVKAAGLPNISGWFQAMNEFTAVSGGFVTASNAGTRSEGAHTSGAKRINFNAKNANSIYGASSTVQPPSQIVHVCIKYK